MGHPGVTVPDAEDRWDGFDTRHLVLPGAVKHGRLVRVGEEPPLQNLSVPGKDGPDEIIVKVHLNKLNGDDLHRAGGCYPAAGKVVQNWLKLLSQGGRFERNIKPATREGLERLEMIFGAHPSLSEGLKGLLRINLALECELEGSEFPIYKWHSASKEVKKKVKVKREKANKPQLSAEIQTGN